MEIPDYIATSIPMTFAQWLERPFMHHITSFQTSGGKFDHGTRFFELDEVEMGKLIKRENKTILPPKKSSSKRQLEAVIRKQLLEKLRRDEGFTKIFQKCRDGDAEMTSELGSQTVRYCEHIYLLAEGGNKLAVKYLAEIAIMATKGLERVAPKHLPALRGLAAYEYAWPTMTSPITSLSSSLPECKELGLGTVLNLGFNLKSRLALDTPIGVFAWKLLNFVANLKHWSKGNIVLGGSYPDEDGKLSLSQMALNLPDFKTDSLVVEKWWKVAERCLIESFPAPGDKASLNEKHPILNKLVTAKSHRKTPKKQRSHLIEKLYEQFRSIAHIPRVSGKKPQVN